MSYKPIRYGFEGLVSNEFHTLNGTCSNLVPSGNGYESVTLANQVCSTVGAIAGEPDVRALGVGLIHVVL
jgi:ATP-binding cassette subfamily G (WHITE) protein 2 (SNQ2)